MKITARLALLCIALTSLGWAPDTFTRRYFSEDQLLTRAAPTLATEGVSASAAIEITVSLVPKTSPGTTTLSGGGKVDLYAYDAQYGWRLLDPSFYSWTLAGCAGMTTCQMAWEILGPYGRILPVANGVTVSSGTQVTVEVTITVSAKSYSTP